MKKRITLKKRSLGKSGSMNVSDIEWFIPPQNSFSHRVNKEHIVSFDKSPTFRKSKKHF